MSADDIVVFFGAGVSAPQPSNLPLFRDFRRAIAGGLGVPVDPATDDLLERVAPELLLKDLYDAGLDVEGLLVPHLSGGAPNALHHALSAVLAGNGRAWTTNADELVEGVLGWTPAFSRVEVAVWRPGPDPPNLSTARLCKPHGSVSTGALAFRSDQVLSLRPVWAQRLVDDARGRHLVLIGYQGADVDIRPALAAAFRVSRVPAVWFEFAGTATERIRRRFSEPVGCGDLDVRGVSNPGDEFLTWLAKAGLQREIAAIDPQLRARLADRPQTAALDFSAALGNQRLVAARLLENLGRRDKARRRLWSVILRGPGRAEACRKQLQLSLASRAWWAPAARALLVQWVRARRLPRRDLGQSLLYYTLEGSGKPKLALEMAELALRDLGETSTRLLNSATAARVAGVPSVARTRAEEALSLAEAERDVQAIARALFELAFLARWQGRLNEADAAVARYEEGYAAMAGTRWVGWASFERGCLALLHGDVTSALTRLDEAEELFANTGHVGGLLAVRQVWVLPLLVRDDIAGARRVLDDVLTARRRRSGRSRFSAGPTTFVIGEVARLDGDLDKADRFFARSARSPYPIHAAFGLLGLGEVERARGLPATSAREAERRFSRIGCRWGEAHALVTRTLAHDIQEADALKRIAAIGYEGFGAGAAKVIALCLGAQPERHVLYFP